MEIHTLPDRLLQSFSWMLVHSIWQGLLLAVSIGLLLMNTTKLSADFRYRMISMHFFLFIVVVLGTFSYEWNLTSVKTTQIDLSMILGGDSYPSLASQAGNVRYLLDVFNQYSTRNAPIIVMIWSLFFVWQLCKLMGNVIGLQQIRHTKIMHPEAHWIKKTQALCQSLGIRKAVALMESGYINFPVVVGHLKPLILIPAGLLSGLPQAQIEAVLLHELAHIRRNDYIVNLLQAITEAIFFFNPGILWISCLLRDEREHCCDDIALTHTGNKKDFIQALISFKEYAAHTSAGYAMAFPGQKNQLLKRVSRILTNKHQSFVPMEKFALVTTVLLLSVFMAFSAITHLQPVRTKQSLPAAVLKQKVAEEKTQETIVSTIKFAIRNTVENTIEDVTTRLMRDHVTIREGGKVTDSFYQADISQDRLQAIQDQVQALKDREQARKDRAQALKDRTIALNAQVLAVTDRRQAMIDKAQALRDEDRAIKDMDQAIRDRNQALRDQQQARNDLRRAQTDQLLAAADRARINN